MDAPLQNRLRLLKLQGMVSNKAVVMKNKISFFLGFSALQVLLFILAYSLSWYLTNEYVGVKRDLNWGVTVTVSYYLFGGFSLLLYGLTAFKPKYLKGGMLVAIILMLFFYWQPFQVAANRVILLLICMTFSTLVVWILSRKIVSSAH